MNNLKKIIFLSIIPAFLTVFFIVKFTVPSVQGYFDLKKKLEYRKSRDKNDKRKYRKS